MFIIFIVDFENQATSDDIVNDTQIIEKIISYTNEELETLRMIDNVIRELLRTKENFSFQRDLEIYPVQFLEKLESLDIEINGDVFQIHKENINKLKQGYRILYAIECTIFVPILSAPSWIKGLIREKDFEMQIESPGFTLESERFHLEILEYDSKLSEILREITEDRLLIFYMLLSQLIEE